MSTSIRTRRRPSEAASHPSALPEALALAIRYRSPDELKPAVRNARTHSPKQLQQIAASLGEFGFVNPILIDADDRVVAGHGRLEAAKSLQMPQVPTVCLSHLNEAQLRCRHSAAAIALVSSPAGAFAVARQHPAAASKQWPPASNSSPRVRSSL